MTSPTRLVLASASPRRAQLLASAGVAFEVDVADIDEAPRPDEVPSHYVRRLAHDKAATVATRDAQRSSGTGIETIVLAADTTVDVDGAILEKPIDDADVARMLRLLSGRAHLVHTGVAVAIDGAIESIVVTTVVTFVELGETDIEWYVATGDGTGKAGGYGIQGAAARFVERVDGSVTNVIGLPLAETLALLRGR